jgi:hypothetical protein
MSSPQQIAANQANGIGDRELESCPFAVMAENSANEFQRRFFID